MEKKAAAQNRHYYQEQRRTGTNMTTSVFFIGRHFNSTRF